MEMKVVTITPQMAEDWLTTRSARNRHISKYIVARYARDMAEGNWVLTHQGLAFDESDRIIDGQHRLAAVVESGKSIRFAVTTGVPTEAMIGIDTGFQRRLEAVLTIAGQQSVSLEMVATARGMIALSEGRDAKRILSPMVVAEFLGKYIDGVEFAVHHMSPKKRSISTADVMAAIARGYYCVDRNIIEAFAHILLTGHTMSLVDDQPVIALREYLIHPIGIRGSSSRVDRYRRTELAIDAYAKGKARPKPVNQWTEVFRLPDEPDWQNMSESGVADPRYLKSRTIELIQMVAPKEAIA